MSTPNAFAAAIAEAAAQTNMNEAVKGGGEARVPDAGMTRLRFISYIELGTHWDEKFKKNKKEVVLQFELSGPKHPVLELEDGRKIPFVITIRESVSLNEKANFYKLFRRMNHTGDATHMAQLLGRDFLGTVCHKKSEDGKTTYANLKDDSGYTIRPPFVEDPETGESKRIAVTDPLNPLRCFIFDYADKSQWDSIFIDGHWDEKKNDAGEVIQEGRSKNIYQSRIRAASDFPGSPIATLLGNGGDPLELGEGEKPKVDEDKRAAAEADPLEGVG